MITNGSTPTIPIANSITPNGYTVVKNDGTTVAGTGAISGLGITLTAGETNQNGVITIIATLAGTAVQAVNDVVGAAPTPGEAFTLACVISGAMAPGSAQVVKANGSTGASTNPPTGILGNTAATVALVAGETNIAGPVGVVILSGGLAVIGFASFEVTSPAVLPGSTHAWQLQITSDLDPQVNINVISDSVANLTALILATRKRGKLTIQAAKTQDISYSQVGAPLAPAPVIRVINDENS